MTPQKYNTTKFVILLQNYLKKKKLKKTPNARAKKTSHKNKKNV